LGNLLWRSSQILKSQEALADYQRGIELLRRARDLLSQPGAERYLVEVLQTLGDALSLQSGHDELLACEERVAILREALTICEDPDLGSLRRVVLGTIGRLKIDMAAMHTRFEQRDLRHKHALAAIDYFQKNLEESDLNGDREGSLRMPSHLVMAYFFASDFEQMSHVLKIAQKRFEQFDPDGDPRFLAAGEFALAAQLKEHPSQAELREIMSADNPVRDYLVSIYAPHLDWLQSKC
jgi:tetratricopeptide (TPR) repeat protein